MKSQGTFLRNDSAHPIRFGDVNLIDPPRQERRGLPLKPGRRCRTVLTGFCGSDWELMQMGRQSRLGPKFPAGQDRLINGHEGVVWVPDEKRYAIVLIRGGDACDPTRFEADETYFEYGCDQADGLMCFEDFYHPDMLLRIPTAALPAGRPLPLALAKRLVFCDPLACMLFQRERLEDLLAGHNWRVYAARGFDRTAAMEHAVHDGLARIVIYGLGGTGILAAIALREKYPAARIVTVGRSAPGGAKDGFLARHWPDIDYVQATPDLADTATRIARRLGGKPKAFLGTSGSAGEADVAFRHGLLANNGIFASFSLGPVVSFDTMPFGFRNHLIFGAINFRREHMEEAISLLCRLPVDELVREYPLAALQANPRTFYEEVFRSPDRALKSVTAWAPDLIGKE